MPTPVAPTVALVTDAASPVGRAVALALAQRGWHLALHYQDDSTAPALSALVQECQALGTQAVAIQCGLTEETEINTLLPRAMQQLGGLGYISCIVNNASHMEHDNPASFSSASLERHMQNNLAAPILLAQALYAATLKNEGAQAVVINVLDQKLFNPQPDFLSYTLSKAALHSATALLAQAYAPQLRVAGVAPSLTMPLTTNGQQPRLPATLEDIAATVCFIASSSAITGSTLVVDGGQHLYPDPRDQGAAHGKSSHPH
ncbi:SDR family NAD(P)-dependent oxidoreductase [Collimonas antrihumi]|uniref:SDR family NAD(P)-dependent oxidoreductase n=1 Tax=Collimonas antrihumi TaxID=1940615 RepID=UPI001B8D185E|nr:SDR family NAD(P)-dependent oxidoreductase [Collimonas antrihumi]